MRGASRFVLLAAAVVALCLASARGSDEDDMGMNGAATAVAPATGKYAHTGASDPVANSTLSVPDAGKACVFDPVTVAWSSNEVLPDGSTAGSDGSSAWIGLFHATLAGRRSVCLHQTPFAVLGLGHVERSSQSDESPDFDGQGASVVGAASDRDGARAGAVADGGDAAEAHGVASPTGARPTQRLRCLLDPLFCDVSLTSMQVFYVILDDSDASEDGGGDDADGARADVDDNAAEGLDSGDDEASSDELDADDASVTPAPSIVATRQLQLTREGMFSTPEGYTEPAATGDSDEEGSADAVVDVRGTVGGDADDDAAEAASRESDADRGHVRLVSSREHPMFYSILTFGQDTNQPPVDTPQQLKHNLEFKGDWGEVVAAHWLNARKLCVNHTVASATMSVSIRKTDTKGAATNQTDTTVSKETVHGSVRFRVTETGSWLVALCGEAPAGVRTLASTSLRVADCDSVPVINPTAPEQVHVDPEPTLELPGTLSFNGDNKFELPHSALPNQAEGSWSLTFWLWLWEHDGGLHALFYKGNGSHPRTPSAWFLDAEPHLTLRVTTNETSDAGVGLRTSQALPLREWVHLAFVFSNVTAAREAEARALERDEWEATAGARGEVARRTTRSTGAAASALDRVPSEVSYTASIYINGRRDTELAYKLPVLPNDNILQVGKGPWNPGFKGLASLLRLYPAALSATTVHGMYEQQRSYFDVATIGGDGSSGDAALSAKGVATELRSVVAATAIAQRWASWRTWFEDVVGASMTRYQGAVDPAEMTAEAKEILADCDGDQAAALHLLRQAAERGHAEAMYQAAMVLLFPSRRQVCDGHANWQDRGVARDTVAARQLLEMASALGHEEALLELAFLVASGVGTGRTGGNLVAASSIAAMPELDQAAPAMLPLSSTAHRSPAAALLAGGDGDSHTRLLAGSPLGALDTAADSDPAAPAGDTELQVEDVPWVDDDAVDGDGGGVDDAVDAARDRGADAMAAFHGAAGSTAPGAALGAVHYSTSHDDSSPGGLLWGTDGELGAGLYHLAVAAHGSEAALALARRYESGVGVAANEELSAFYALVAATEAKRQHDAAGQQPDNEMNRLTEDNEETVKKGQLGEDDVLIQTVKMQAEEGNVHSMLEMANLYYWGHHGLPRDQAESFRWYERAAETGNPVGQFACGNMLRKGEGAAQNHTEALRYFRLAAAQNNTRALNGLGIAYLHGHGDVEQNLTKGFEYFQRAAEQNVDGDSLFNEAFCHMNGYGTNKSLDKARALFIRASNKFAHMGSRWELGNMLIRGEGGARDVPTARFLLTDAASKGAWGGAVRDGFEMYLKDDFDGATIRYLRAWELGYETGAANAAYLLHTERADHGSLVGYDPEEESAGRVNQFLGARMAYELSLDAGGKDSALKLGDYFFYGLGGLPTNPLAAAAMYSRASAAGSSQAAFNLGLMNEYGTPNAPNPQRAEKYYLKAMELAPEKARVPVYLALTRMKARAWLRKVGAPSWLVKALRLDLVASGEKESVPARVYEAGMGLDLDGRGDRRGATGDDSGAGGALGVVYEWLMNDLALLAAAAVAVSIVVIALRRVRRQQAHDAAPPGTIRVGAPQRPSAGATASAPAVNAVPVSPATPAAADTPDASAAARASAATQPVVGTSPPVVDAAPSPTSATLMSGDAAAGSPSPRPVSRLVQPRVSQDPCDARSAPASGNASTDGSGATSARPTVAAGTDTTATRGADDAATSAGSGEATRP